MPAERDATMKKINQKIGYLFLAPLALIVIVFLLYPFIKGFILSFFETKYGFGNMQFVAFENYFSVIKDKSFLLAIKNSLIWVLAGLVLNTVFPMLIAILINRNFIGKQLTMGIMLISWMTPVVGFSMMWKWLLEPQLGIVNEFLKYTGVIDTRINFLGDSNWAFGICIFLNFLQFFPFGVLLMLSALSVIPNELYDAMRIDGATQIKIFTNLILPVAGSMISFLAFLGIVWTFSNYSLIYVLTKGGPNYSTYTVPIMIYEKAFSEFQVGQSLALASIVAVVLILIGILFGKSFFKKVEI